MHEINNKDVTARKEHICNWCGGIIEKGSVYNKQTNIFDNTIYEWKSHLDCYKLTGLLNMSKYDDGAGINEEMFAECINNYLYEHHYDNEKEDIEEKWNNMTLQEKATMIAEEISKVKNTLK